jgi:hypothetical protein
VRIALVGASLAIGLVVLALNAQGSGGASRATPPSPREGRIGPEGVPLLTGRTLAAAASPRPGQVVQGVACGPAEQVAFHTHSHLAVFVAGQPRVVPAGIGIAPPLEIETTPAGAYAAGGACFSYLHTHAADGIIHVESPVQRAYTLGNFFAVWNQPLGARRVGPAVGPVTAFLNGRRYVGNPRRIPLLPHAQIQLDVGRPLIAPVPIAFPPGL